MPTDGEYGTASQAWQSYSFTAGGSISASGVLNDVGKFGNYWSSTSSGMDSDGSGYSAQRYLYGGTTTTFNIWWQVGYSVRCVAR